MRTRRLFLPAAVLLAAAWSAAPAGELLDPGLGVEEAVDHYVEERLAREGVRPAPPADDATTVRRLTLDLLGRVPTEAESRAFVDSTDPEKRGRLVDRLLAAPGFARQQAEAFDAVLMAGTRESIRDYLAAAFRAGRPWDQVFRELLAADESAPGLKGAAGFLKPRARDLDRLTSEVSSVFFGVNVSCAKCHDHPRVKGWTQDLFYGMKSFLGRTYLEGNFVAERDRGGVTYKTVGGEERKAKFMFLSGREVELPAPEGPPEGGRR